MTKLYQSPVQVELDTQGRSKRFRWLGRWHRILSCAAREDNRHWWAKTYRPEPMRYRCETYQGLICELYYANEPGTWVLERVWD